MANDTLKVRYRRQRGGVGPGACRMDGRVVTKSVNLCLQGTDLESFLSTLGSDA